MSNPALAAEILVGFLALGIPLTGPFERRIYRSEPATSRKLIVYGANVVLLWSLAIAAVCIEGSWEVFKSPAAGATWLWAPAISSPLLSLAVGVYLTLGFLPLIQSLRGPRWQRAYAAAMRRGFSDIPGLLPNTTIERAAWIPLSLTAGVCEEVLFRGFLIRFLHEGEVGMPLGAALAVSSLIFGVAHNYQGRKGVLTSMLGGLALGLVFLLTGSLIASIVLHVLLDLQTPYLLRPIPEDDAISAETA
ncbi:CPBP family intramembrane glutamic endopeptidase [Phenylobacterium sp.]|uniref:CPBP family intramembrane glutamic endopeptidase n=1 Tax=Phenylobacterium sp. TaxID=1871053 RepID=UPI00374CAD79